MAHTKLTEAEDTTTTGSALGREHQTDDSTPQTFSRRQFRKVWLTGTETILSPTIDDLPYLDYVPGQGINAITGQKANIALEPYKIEEYPPFAFHEKVTEVYSDETYSTLFDAETGGAYNSDGILVSGSAKYLHDVTYSATSLTFVAEVKIESQGPGDLSDRPQLTVDARALLEGGEQGPTKFRDVYGDYFVATWKGGSRFLGLYTCQSTDSDSLDQFRANLSADGLGLMTVNGATSFKTLAKQHNIKYTCSINMEGLKNIPPAFENSPDGITKALDWFLASDPDGKNKNLRFTPSRVYLWHYATLSNKALTKLPIDPAAFGEIRTIRFYVTENQMMLKQLPKYYSDLKDPVSGEPIRLAVDKLVSRFTAEQAKLPTDQALRDSLLNDAKEIFNILKPGQDLFTFYSTFINTDYKDRDKSGTYTTSFGLSKGNRTAQPVKIKVAEHTIYKDWQLAKKQSGTFRFPFENVKGDNIVVGWTIANNWNDSTDGHWWGGGLIGKNTGEVNVEGQLTRQINWSMQVFYVEKKNFPWL